MKISLISDVHTDIGGCPTLPGGDVLIVAGDVCEVRQLVNEYHSTKVLPYTPGQFPCYDFFHNECTKYQKVFYVMGNHEHYHGKFWKTADQLRSMLPSNVTLLDDQYEEYKGVIFVGSTLWTDMNRENPITLHMIKDYMNDYRVITYFDQIKNIYRKLNPTDTVRQHKQSKYFIESTAQKYPDRPVVVITHMAPTFMSVNEKYKHEKDSNGAYCSDLSEFILDNPNIKVWVHGHVHDPVDYMVGDTRVLCNPRGYFPYEAENGFDIHFTFEV